MKGRWPSFFISRPMIGMCRNWLNESLAQHVSGCIIKRLLLAPVCPIEGGHPKLIWGLWWKTSKTSKMSSSNAVCSYWTNDWWNDSFSMMVTMTGKASKSHSFFIDSHIKLRILSSLQNRYVPSIMISMKNVMQQATRERPAKDKAAFQFWPQTRIPPTILAAIKNWQSITNRNWEWSDRVHSSLEIDHVGWDTRWYG